MIGRTSPVVAQSRRHEPARLTAPTTQRRAADCRDDDKMVDCRRIPEGASRDSMGFGFAIAEFCMMSRFIVPALPDADKVNYAAISCCLIGDIRFASR
jgi:hypothetical protein